MSAASTSTQLHVRDGMSQERRFLAAFEPGYFDVDEQRFEQLLMQMHDYSRLVALPGVALDEPLFGGDELLIMAQILAYNSAELERQFQQRVQQSPQASEWIYNDHHTPSSIAGLVGLMDHWHHQLRLAQSEAGEQLYALIDSLREGLARDLAFGGETRLQANQTLRQRLQGFIEARTRNLGDGAMDDNHHWDNRTFYAALLKALDMIQLCARDQLPHSLRSQNHDPALALRVAFVQLYQRLQKRLNRFTLELVDFYYRDILQAQSRRAQADSVFLVVHNSLRGKRLQLPQGTEFVAGLDAQSREILYAADAALEVNDAQVDQLYSLYFPRLSLGESQRVTLADGCWLNAIHQPADPKSTKSPSPKPQPLLGAPRHFRGNSGLDPQALQSQGLVGDGRSSANATPARLGFALASQVLLLSEGQRQLKLELVFDAIERQYWTKLKNILRLLPNIKDSIADDQAKFFAYFGKFFEISLTTSDGWFAISEYKPAYKATDPSVRENALRLDFDLPVSCPPITPYQAELHGDALSTQLPVLKVTLRENYLQYPYDVLRHLVVREARIQVEVKGCNQLLLYNNIGQLSAMSPFAPFGPLPDIGSYLVVGHEEIRSKQLTQLSLDIEWGGLPGLQDGFKRWYQAYAQERNNDQFVVSASALANSRWHPEPGAARSPRLPLFSTHLKNGSPQLLAHQRINLDSAIAYHQPQDKQQRQQPLSYSTSTRSGLFRLTLQGPEGTFGHREYAQLLADTLTHNARVKLPKFMRQLPLPPYTPEINAIRLNYSAQAIITLAEAGREGEVRERDQFFHLHPQGWEVVSPLRHPRTHLLPQYPDAGNLFIGINASEPQALSLLFQLCDNSLPIPTELLTQESETQRKPQNYEQGQNPLLSWAYLSDNQWLPLEPRQLRNDSTRNFMATGILGLDMPVKMTKDNSVMPPGRYWLKLSANRALPYFSEILSVHTQAVQASWRSGEHPAAAQARQLPAESIKRLRRTQPGITGVTQLRTSFGGQAQETQAQLRRRLSERLRHKQRALSPTDYEMLILEAFPQVYKVKCFANINRHCEPWAQPGQVLIIPIPHLSGAVGGEDYFQPHFDGHTIQSIREFIAPLAPPQIRISVENPCYEEIQVRCSVGFKKDCHPGEHQNRLNLELSEFLSPWSPNHGNQVHFGWSLGEQEIKSFIHHRDYVDYVTDFSLLRVATQRNGLFHLEDTAASSAPGRQTLKPSYPWTTAVPLDHHYLLLLDQNIPIQPLPTGLNEMEVGSTFIISG